MTAFRPEPQTLLMVIAGTALGSPALIDAWRAGFCPLAAVSTWPRMTSEMSGGSSLARASSAWITVAPSSGAGVFASVPPNFPIAVRTAPAMTMSDMWNLLEDRSADRRFDGTAADMGNTMLAHVGNAAN